MVILLIVAGVDAPTLVDMARAWWEHPYAGHGVFVPLFSALVAWMDRDRLRASVGPGTTAGLAIILLSVAVLALGRYVDSLLVQGVAVTGTVAGAVLWIWGKNALRQAAFPVGFLVFMTPLPAVVVGAVTRDLQLFAARSAGVVLELLGVPFYQHGMIIELPTIALDVAEVCNGLRFLMALLVLSIAFAEISQRTLPRKLLLSVSAIPIAILANAIRVATLAIAVYLFGPGAASGIIHHGIGKTVWILTLVPLGALGLVLRRGPGDTISREKHSR